MDNNFNETEKEIYLKLLEAEKEAQTSSIRFSSKEVLQSVKDAINNT